MTVYGQTIETCIQTFLQFYTLLYRFYSLIIQTISLKVGLSSSFTRGISGLTLEVRIFIRRLSIEHGELGYFCCGFLPTNVDVARFAGYCNNNSIIAECNLYTQY